MPVTGKTIVRRLADLCLMVILTLCLCHLTGIATPVSRLRLTSGEELTQTRRYHAKDLLVSQQIKPWELKAQDTILIHNGAELSTQQITEITHDGEDYTFSGASDTTIIRENMLEAKVLFAIPQAGFIAKLHLHQQVKNSLLIIIGLVSAFFLCRSVLNYDDKAEVEETTAEELN